MWWGIKNQNVSTESTATSKNKKMIVKVAETITKPTKKEKKKEKKKE